MVHVRCLSPGRIRVEFRGIPATNRTTQSSFEPFGFRCLLARIRRAAETPAANRISKPARARVERELKG